MKYILAIAILILALAGNLSANITNGSAELDNVAWAGYWGPMAWQAIPALTPPSYLTMVTPTTAPDGSKVFLCKAASTADQNQTWNTAWLEAGTYNISLQARRASIEAFGVNARLVVTRHGQPATDPTWQITPTQDWVSYVGTITSAVPWQLGLAVLSGGNSSDAWIEVDAIRVDRMGTPPPPSVAVLPGGFVVTQAPPPEPTILSISPATSPNNTDAGVVIAGTGFRPGATATLRMVGQPDVIGRDVVVNSDESISCTFALVGVASGSWDVVVTSPQ